MTSNCPMQGVSLSKTTWRIEGELFCDVDKLGQSTSYVRLVNSEPLLNCKMAGLLVSNFSMF